MPEINVTMDDVPNDYTPLDDSLVYGVRIVDAQLRHSRDEGNPYISVHLTVTDPPEWAGKDIYDNRLALPGRTLPTDTASERRRKLERGVRLKQFMAAFKLGWGPEGFSTEDWSGAEARCTIRNEEFNDQVTSRPRKYFTR